MDGEVLAPEIDAFIDAFRIVGNGDIADNTARGLKKCVKATMLEGKKSTLTIKLEITRTTDETIAMSGEVNTKVPVPKVVSSFFVNRMTNLPTRNRPNQGILPNTN